MQSAGSVRRRNNGAQGRDRTTDTVIFSHVLYQLSYLGAGPAKRTAQQGAGVIKAQIRTVQNAPNSGFNAKGRAEPALDLGAVAQR